MNWRNFKLVAVVFGLLIGNQSTTNAQVDRAGENIGIVCDATLILQCGGGDNSVHETAHGNLWKGFHGDFDCWVCLDGGGPVDANNCHGFCNDHLTSTQHATYQQLLAAGRSGDVRRLVALARILPGYAFYNAERNSIQVRTCRQSGFIANIPLTSAAELRLARALTPSPQARLALTNH